ncbi:PRD domain-containing protein [Enterococcus sp. S52]|nr:PRD domain-containing protein [Enterococcus sp. S52]MBK0072049.1 PRD domain-containing protein [Enterococcus sp. S53]MBK0142640.1 PRD domain-containing protein [Enterococcus sp. S76]MBK0146278.1 PRD domain-containing protein [Enterococcus sp. S77]
MRAIRKLNNNVVICLDNNNCEVIAMGKGLGFGELPREISLSEVERSFYNIDLNGQNIMKDLPTEIVIFTAKIIDIVSNELPYELSPNAVLLLSDHIAFAIERIKNSMGVKMGLLYDVKQRYPLEYKIGRYIVSKIYKEFRVLLPEEEIAAIALNLINANINRKIDTQQAEINKHIDMLEEITEIVENQFYIIIDRESFEFSRWATHLQYLFQRIDSDKLIDSANLQMYNTFKSEFVEVSTCVDKISSHIAQEWDKQLSEEEKLYLMLHLNRIIIRKGL